ncbi:Hypothetical protein FKW44_000664 [Caligus rogercresseyi]|uniref:Uncharacterized protein n=1 Tax=Caligus rogercresseyi TaxID=217165 RepID=A0A7T8H1Y6_CALRO|nr:Hypothetical protein FKW44_018426 [Caligus rogercresseyi]QQP41958.1 Hypothetical protein FKW44_016478 [Caligus rogercresseyi]QQP56107.1 Hypothetical protein FKW44_000664 [Caligus rogercresseyi]
MLNLRGFATFWDLLFQMSEFPLHFHCARILRSLGVLALAQDHSVCLAGAHLLHTASGHRAAEDILGDGVVHLQVHAAPFQ